METHQILFKGHFLFFEKNTTTRKMSIKVVSTDQGWESHTCIAGVYFRGPGKGTQENIVDGRNPAPPKKPWETTHCWYLQGVRPFQGSLGGAGTRPQYHLLGPKAESHSKTGLMVGFLRCWYAVGCPWRTSRRSVSSTVRVQRTLPRPSTSSRRGSCLKQVRFARQSPCSFSASDSGEPVCSNSFKWAPLILRRSCLTQPSTPSPPSEPKRGGCSMNGSNFELEGRGRSLPLFRWGFGGGTRGDRSFHPGSGTTWNRPDGGVGYRGFLH